MSRRFVFVPVFGDISNGAYNNAQWVEAPHVKVWGFYENDMFTPIHADPPLRAVGMGQPFDLFSAELAEMRDVDDEDQLPDEVCLALAKLALLPVSPANSND
jgi:hypothetical protein